MVVPQNNAKLLYYVSNVCRYYTFILLFKYNQKIYGLSRFRDLTLDKWDIGIVFMLVWNLCKYEGFIHIQMLH